MIKRPAVLSFVSAGILALGFAGYLLATARNVDEKPFIL